MTLRSGHGPGMAHDACQASKQARYISVAEGCLHCSPTAVDIICSMNHTSQPGGSSIDQANLYASDSIGFSEDNVNYNALEIGLTACSTQSRGYITYLPLRERNSADQDSNLTINPRDLEASYAVPSDETIQVSYRRLAWEANLALLRSSTSLFNQASNGNSGFLCIRPGSDMDVSDLQGLCPDPRDPILSEHALNRLISLRGGLGVTAAVDPFATRYGAALRNLQDCYLMPGYTSER